MTTASPEHFTDGSIGSDYQSELADLGYQAELISTFNAEWNRALVEQLPGESVEYVHFNHDESGDRSRVFLVPGLVEGIKANGPLMLDLASRGYETIAPGQNRTLPYRWAGSGDKIFTDVTLTHAIANMAVLEDAGWTHSPVDIVAHSYGSIIFSRMVELAKVKRWTCFDESKVAMLAPAGTNERERYPKLMGREVLEVARTVLPLPSRREINAGKKEMDAAAVEYVKADIRRWVAEVREIRRASNQIDYAALQQNVGSVSVFAFGGDFLFPHRSLKRTMSKATGVNPDYAFTAAYAVPISYDTDDSGNTVVGGRWASHNDHMFNPSTTGAALAQFFE